MNLEVSKTYSYQIDGSLYVKAIPIIFMFLLLFLHSLIANNKSYLVKFL